jgi:hypothetical protein
VNVDIKIDDTQIKAFLKGYSRELSQDVDRSLSRTAQVGINMILDRTHKGTGYTGKFPDYSDTYKAFKSQKVGSGSPTVDLTLTGSMLSSMTSETKNGVATLFFSRASEAKKAKFNDRLRPFFGFNQSEVKRLASFFKKDLFR